MPKVSTWTPEMLAYVATHYPNSSTQAIAAHLGKSPLQICQKAYELNVKKSKAAKGRSTDKWRVLDEIIALIYADMHNHDIEEFLGIKHADLISRACMLGLKKSKKIMHEVAQRRAVNFSAAHQFKPGLVPWNKGMRGFDPVLGRGLYRNGLGAPHAVPIGTTRLRGATQQNPTARQYLEKKVAEPSVWVRVHRLVWEQANGPVPDEHIIVFRPGQYTIKEEEITLDRLECITRVELATRNHPMNHHPDLAPIYQLKSAISRQINRIKQEQKEAA